MSIIQAYSKCPKCKTEYSCLEVAKEAEPVLAGWSDGFLMASKRRDVLLFSKCPTCGTFFWLRKNSIPEPMGSTVPRNIENFLSLDNIGRKEIDFVKEALRSGIANTTKKEIYLRTKLWHVINHILRKYDSQDFFSKVRHQFFESVDYKNAIKLYNYEISLKISNLIRLMNLFKLDKNENQDYLLLAEIYREIGDFGKAMVFGHKAKKMAQVDQERIMLLEKNIAGKNKAAYKL